MNEIMAKYGTFIMIAVWIAIIYFFMILPNKKKQKKQTFSLIILRILSII